MCFECAARFNQTNPLFGPVFGGGPTLWMGGTAPSFYDDHLYVVTGQRHLSVASSSSPHVCLRT